MAAVESGDDARGTPEFDTAVAFRTPWFSVLERIPRAGGPSYFAVKPRDYVSVLAVTANDELLLVHQFRPAIEQWNWEFPGGTVDHDEDPDAAMARELREETGYRAVRLQRLGVLQPDTGRLANRLFAYFADVEPDPDRLQPDADEWSLRPMLLGRAQFVERQSSDPRFMVQALHMAIMHLAAATGVYDVLRR
jgi:8-oxo-dGTP pyrophosphatase MutT (NUDIX family)